MIALVKEPGKLPREIDITPDLATLQDLVGGYIEAVHIAEDLILIVNETGKLDGLPANVFCGDDYLAGNVVALGVSPDADADFRSLTVDELDLLKSASRSRPWIDKFADRQRIGALSWRTHNTIFLPPYGSKHRLVPGE